MATRRWSRRRTSSWGPAARTDPGRQVRPNGACRTRRSCRSIIDSAKATALGLSLSRHSSTLSARLGSAATSMISSIAAGSSASIWRPTRPTACSAGRSLRLVCAQCHGRHGAVLGLCDDVLDQRSVVARALQRLSGSGDSGLGGAGRKLRHGDGRDGEAGGASCRPAIGYEWTGLSYQERLSGAQAPALYALSILVVFLCLAALYESWSIPFSVLLVVPLGVVGALLAATLRGIANDVYLQGRPADDHRAVGEERHPDRRVRQGPARAGMAASPRRRSRPRVCASGRS